MSTHRIATVIWKLLKMSYLIFLLFTWEPNVFFNFKPSNDDDFYRFIMFQKCEKLWEELHQAHIYSKLTYQVLIQDDWLLAASAKFICYNLNCRHSLAFHRFPVLNIIASHNLILCFSRFRKSFCWSYFLMETPHCI